MRKMNVSSAGCVLAGGKSRRMGTDKALLEVSGKPLIIHAAWHFRDFPEVFISATDPERYAFTGIRIIADENPDMGPLGGIISVLKAAQSEFVCFRPVDAPLVPSALHTRIAEACFEKDAAVPVFAGRTEPLLACFSKTALPALEALAAQRDYKISNVFSTFNTTYVSLDTAELIRELGNPAAYLINANDPDTFRKFTGQLECPLSHKHHF